jgi:uncharacterized protein (TIGR03000 family)
MYSVVLMMAMTGGGDASVANWRHGCDGGCSGCSGYGCSGCSGYGCSGYGCSGCSGYGWGGHGCSGCSGYGWGCSGCHGGSYSCSGCHGGGFFSRWRGHGCHGCSGGYSCNGCYGGYGCYGSGCYGGYGGYGCSGSGCYGGYGCNGGYGCYGSGCYGGTPVAPGTPAEQIKIEPKKDEAPKGEEKPKIEEKPKAGEDAAVRPAPATLVVSLPTNAVLTVDGAATKSTSAERTFITPDLSRGKEYFYRLQATWESDGKTIVVNKRVAVRPGQEVRVSLGAADAASVASR